MKLRDSRKREAPISGVNTNGSPDLAALFDGHVAREFADCDVDSKGTQTPKLLLPLTM